MVINQAGALSSDAATLTINSGPVITQPPVPQTIECASNAVFTVLALGDPPLFYQWFFGTNSIPGANDSTLVVSNVTSSKAGNYSVLVTNQLGTNTSVPATLAVVDTRPPVILVCAPAQHYAANTNCQITLSNLTSSVIATDACSSVTITQVPPPGTVLGIGTTNVAFIATDTSGNASTCTVVVTVQDLAAPVIVFSFTNLTLAAGTNCQALMPNLTTTNYLLAVDSCSSVTVTQSVATSTPLALGTNLVVLTAFDTSGNTTFSTNAVVVVDATPPVITCPADLIVSADFLHTSKSNVTFIATATDNCNVTNISCVPSSGSTFPLGTNQVNCTATDASGNSAGCAFNIIVTPAGPVTATANQTVNLGIPDGSPVGLVNSLDIATSIERITNVTVTLNVSGGFNGDLHAYLIHDAGHAILLNRVGKTLANPSGYSDSGLNVTFTDSAANGDIHNYRQTLFGNPSMPQAGPLTNAWAPDGRDIDPALVLDSTPSTALLSAFHGLNPNGRWTLFIADVDAVYSSTLVSWGLEIRGTSAPPVITVQPQSRTNVAGSTAAFSVTATALSTPSYQWYFGPTAISGATNATLTLPDVQSTNAGDYMVIVTSLGGSTASDAARLTVQSLVVTGQVALQEYMGPAQNGFGIRTVTFKATGSNGSVLATWDLPLNFTPGPNRSGVAFYTLTNVPSGTIRLSAKTAWHLRSRLPATFTNGEAAVNFTGTQTLRGGDINGSNLVDMGDYNQLAAAWYTTQSGSDIDGSGLVDIFDYFLLASHWSQEGDPE